MSNNTLQIFYACDNNFVKYTMVSVLSLMENADPTRRYHIHVLHTDITEEMQGYMQSLAREGFTVTFDDVSEYLHKLSERLPIRDYYTRSTYYRLFIPDMYPEYDRALYIDSDTVILGDVSQVLDTPLGDALVGACHEQVMIQTEVYGNYVEQVCGVDRHSYFNAGVLLINCAAHRREGMLARFCELLAEYSFRVTQDEDYLNVLCAGRVLWLPQGWNTQVYGTLPVPPEEMRLIHYIMTAKPWHYEDCRLKEHFWRYAEKSPLYSLILEDLHGHTPEKKAQDAASGERLALLAAEEIAREDAYIKVRRARYAPDRLAVLSKIEEYERRGWFDRDVEADPPSRVLRPEDITYLRHTPLSRAKRAVSFAAARLFFRHLQWKKKVILNPAQGIEHLKAPEDGVIITCNHFHPFDSFIMQRVFDAAHREGRMYRVIREGNYTSYPGFYGMLMRHCDTLPLSSDPATMKLFLKATYTALREKNSLLIYPEQSLWWNYRKPKPQKLGAFEIAVRCGAPVVPCFITFEDTDRLGEDGFPILSYTPHVGAPIYPDPTLSRREAAKKMRDENEAFCRATYERVYGIPLRYTTAPKESAPDEGRDAAGA